jgi:hypothetical protein
MTPFAWQSSASPLSLRHQRLARSVALLSERSLTRNATGQTRPHEDAAIAQCKITPQQKEELVKYIEGLTERHLPPTRQMIQNFATEIAGDEVSESWVTRFLNRHLDRLIVNANTGRDG